MTKKIFFLLAISLITNSCNSQNTTVINNLPNVDTQAKIEPTILKFIQRNDDIIPKCVFSLHGIDSSFESIYNNQLDINIYDALIVKINKDSSYIYKYIQNEFKVNFFNDKKQFELIKKWCYCYRVLESVFVFEKNIEYTKYNFENIVANIPELKPILGKYINKYQTIDALSTSQSETLFLDCVNYITLLDSKRTNTFFVTYFKTAANLQ